MLAREMNRWHLDGGRMWWIAALAAAVITGTLYFRTVHPGVGPYLDSVEYQLTTRVSGVSHPPGHPLFVLLPILRDEGGTIGYRIVGRRTAHGAITPWVSSERWAEVSSQVVLP